MRRKGRRWLLESPQPGDHTGSSICSGLSGVWWVGALVGWGLGSPVFVKGGLEAGIGCSGTSGIVAVTGERKTLIVQKKRAKE